MTEKCYQIVGLGEVLFDVLPGGEKMPGGAPANFAHAAAQFGNRGILASRVGADANGNEIRRALKKSGVDVSRVQIDAQRQTGTVIVSLLEDNQPTYEITENAAWDFLELTADWRALAQTCDAVCFGSLAQRNQISRQTIREFIQATKSDCLRVFDVNLRQHYFSAEILEKSLRFAGIVKLNHEELPKILDYFSIGGADEIEKIQRLREKFDLQIVCVTRGENGSLLISADEIAAHPGIKTKIADTIGAGDAFTAALIDGLLRSRQLDEINENANRTGAFVASKKGAMHDFSGLIKL